MRIAMFSNIFTPLYAGLTKSMLRLRRLCQSQGHEVLVVCPSFEDQPTDEEGVIRLPALKKFSGTHYSLVLPFQLDIDEWLDAFKPDLIHAQHPFLVGDTALHVSVARQIPLVYTHHTLYEHYTHYMPVDFENMDNFLQKLVAAYCNYCSAVIAPSNSVKDILTKTGVESRIEVIPTGVDGNAYRDADGRAMREELDLEKNRSVLGFAGRLRPEKNLGFLSEAVAHALQDMPDAQFLVAGDGSEQSKMEAIFEEKGVREQVRFLGVLSSEKMIQLYHALDLFVFSSKSETQGMVLAEAMAAGTPVVALDGPGSRDIVEDGVNGQLVREEDPSAFGDAILQYFQLSDKERASLSESSRKSVASLDVQQCGAAVIKLYKDVLENYTAPTNAEDNDWQALVKPLQVKWDLWSGRFVALADALVHDTSA